MCVEILKIGSFTLYGYGFMIAIGCICALIVARYRAKLKKLDSDFVLDLFCYCAIFGFLGAKLLYCLVSFDDFIKNPIHFLGSSGFVVYGGIILGFVGGLIACKRKKKNFLDYFDLVMPYSYQNKSKQILDIVVLEITRKSKYKPSIDINYI